MKPHYNREETDFLLGKLSEHDRELIEKEYFNDAELFNDLLIAESELFDAYAAGQLSADDNDRFASRLMITRKQRERAAFAGALAEYASRSSGADKVTLISKWKSGVYQLFSANPLLSYSLSSAGILLIALTGFWFMSSGTAVPPGTNVAVSIPPEFSDDKISNVYSPPDRSELTEETANKSAPKQTRKDQKANSRLAASPPAARGLSQFVFTIVLSPGSVRDAERSTVFVLPKAATRVAIKLEYDEFDHESYYAVVETADGQQVWRGKARHKNGSALINIPSGRITSGDYIISLKGMSPMKTFDTVADYTFTVERK